MYGWGHLRRTAPWLLCVVSLVLLGLASVLPWFVSDPASPGPALEATVTALGFVGIPVVGALIA